MAAPASSKPGWVHYTCAFFVVLSLILGVGLYLSNSAFTEREATWAAETKKASDALGAASRALQDISNLKNIIGESYETIGAPGDNNATSVIGAMTGKIALAGDLAQPTYSATIMKLAEEYNNTKNLIAAANADLATANAKILALQAEYQEKVTAEVAAKEKVEGSLAANTTESAEERTKKDKEIDEQRAALKQSQDEFAKLDDEFKKFSEEAGKRQKNLLISIQLLKDELRDLRNYGFEQPLGKIVRVNTDANTVTINLGKVDRLSTRTTMSVYTKANSGVARGAEDIKGAIEVIEIIGPHLATARITQETMPADPIAPGDPIYTPAWSPGRLEKFAFVGKFDFDGDGKHDEDQLQELLAVNGAVPGAQVDQKGVRNNRKIDHETKFLVVGEIPDPTEISDPEERRAVDEVKKHHENMKKEADEQGVTVVRKNDFLTWMGYRPRHKLFKAGDPRPNNLPGSRTNGNQFSSGSKTGKEKTYINK